jgi:hypothetical protein
MHKTLEKVILLDVDYLHHVGVVVALGSSKSRNQETRNETELCNEQCL